MDNFSKFAFISYSHRDMAVAKWLHRKLEGFKLPTEIHNDVDARSRYLRPVFRDQADLDSGILSEELVKNLRESKYLILICSKYSADSEWVSDEAKAFVEMGRLDRIIPVIIPDGTTPENRLFPRYLREYFREHPDKELLGVNIGEVGREKALVRVVSRMLNVSFDTLWQRHKRQQRRRIIVVSALSAVAVAAIYLFAVPVDVHVAVEMQPSQLPLGDNVELQVNGAEYVSSAVEPHFDKIRLPGYRRFSDIKLSVYSQFFQPVDTVLPTGYGVRRDIMVVLHRDDTFAHFAGTVYDSDMNPMSGVKITMPGTKTVTGPDGTFAITLPLSKQRVEQTIMLEKDGYITLIRCDETPGTELKYIMHRD